MMLLGLRGTGKTVLLNEIQKIGNDAGLLTSKLEAPEGDSLARLLLPQMRKVMRSLSTIETAKDSAVRAMRGLRGFVAAFKIKVAGVSLEIEPEPGLADSGDIELDLPDLFTVVGEAAQAAGKGWVLLIDEVQYLTEKELSAMIIAIHEVNQKGLPLLFVGAGLPMVAKLAGDAKSYAERLFEFPVVEALTTEASAQAIVRPLDAENVRIERDALNTIVERTQGYPFFLQEWAAMAWDQADGETIKLPDVEKSYQDTIAKLDEGFFKVRVDRLTKSELRFVRAMAAIGDSPYAMSDIAAAMDRTLGSLSPTRASIIRKGMAYSPDHGQLAFTVPLFAEFIRRTNP